MDQTIQKAISRTLKGRSSFPMAELESSLAQELGVPRDQIERVFGEMKDREEVGYLPDNNSLVRLTYKGVQSPQQKMIHYIATHWIAIAALILSIISMLKK